MALDSIGHFYWQLKLKHKKPLQIIFLGLLCRHGNFINKEGLKLVFPEI